MRFQFSIRWLLLLVLLSAFASWIAHDYYIAHQPARIAAKLNALGAQAEVLVEAMPDYDVVSMPVEAKHIEGDRSCQGLSFELIRDALAFSAVASANKIDSLRILDIEPDVVVGDCRLTRLKSLAAGNATDQQVSDLIRAAPNLRSITIWKPSPQMPKTLKKIARHNEVRCVDLSGFSLNTSDIKQLRKAGRMKQLLLRGCEIAPGALSELEFFPALSELSLQGNLVVDSTLKEISTFTRITKLDLSDSGITDAGVKTLGAMSHLRELDVYGCENITKDSVNDLIKLKSLHRLTVLGTKIEDDPRLRKHFRYKLREWIY